ncbi:MAG: hypothetical protein QNJ34_16940 [Xenococcaceae cyanobacterium MO_188.B29]|nr:hypothetical protein [Xenococcaceae cyanobacterium MO_188.B29]
MKTYEKIEIVRNPYFQPEKIKTVLLVFLCSFAVGLIPIVYSISASTPDNIVPSEGTLWK